MPSVTLDLPEDIFLARCPQREESRMSTDRTQHP